MKNDASIALSYPQNRTARRVWSYERLWLGKSITPAALIKSSLVHYCAYRDWDQRAPTAECALQRALCRCGKLAKKARQIFAGH